MNKLWTPDRKLYLPPPTLVGFWLEVGAWDRKGRIIHQERILSRSPVKQLLQLLLTHIAVANHTITDVLGAAKDVNIHQNTFNSQGTLNDDTKGIVIGTDNTPVDMTDYQLVAQIMDGSAAGQMIHNAMAFDATVTVADPDCTFDMWRNYNNNSGASITVKETGIYCCADAGNLFYFLIVRDVPTEIVVPDGGGCYVKYTPKITE